MNDIIPVDSSEPESKINVVEVARAREIIRAQIAIAKNFPRDERKAEEKILLSCQRSTFANLALYRYPRGGAVVEGPSIRLAETLANRWGNLDYGWSVKEQNDKEAQLEAWCHDLESNTRKAATWNVKLVRTTKAGARALTDARDIYETQANEGARRIRACILAIIPPEVVAAAVAQIRKTVVDGEKNIPMPDKIKAMIRIFATIGVSQEMIEARLKHSVDILTPEQLVDFKGIFASLRDNQSTRSEWFDIPEHKPKSAFAERLAETNDA